jgi:predicted MFS family arabinose efflux permease
VFGQAMGGILGDFMGWREVFMLLAAMLALAAALLVWELIANPATRSAGGPIKERRGLVADYAIVLGNPWARAVIAAAALEAGLMWGTYAYVGADLHLRFGLSLTMVGLVVAAFGLGGLIYSLSVKQLVFRFGQIGLATTGGVLLATGYLVLVLQPVWWFAPAATMIIGLGFYMLHNTLQTNATQMSPEARGTAVAIFSSALYLGQTVGVGAVSLTVDRFTAVPAFVVAAIGLLLLGLWFARRLRRRA